MKHILNDEDFRRWRDERSNLPWFMRDFHDQKDLFKFLDSIERKGVDGTPYDVNWMAATCYVVDVFLWVMASHGWTLQRTRKKFSSPYQDIAETVAAHREQSRNAAFEALGLRLAKGKEAK